MRQESALWGPSLTSRSAPEDALGLIDESRRLISAILLGVIMQLQSLNLERCQILGNGTPCTASEIEQLQLGASLLTVWALMGFHQQAAGLGDTGEQTLGSVSLTIGLIRLMKLLCPEAREESEDEEILELTDPLE